MLSVVGPRSFIASNLLKLYPGNTIPVDHRVGEYQWSGFPNNNVVSFVSTTHNYWFKEGEYRQDITVNLIYLMNFLEALYKQYKDDFTFSLISSWFVAGNQDKLPVDENCICSPTGTYSITKRTAELLLINFCNTIGGRYKILRLCNVVGAGDKFSEKKNALQYLIHTMMCGRDINLYWGGNFYRDYMVVEDVAKIIYKLINEAPVNNIYNIGSGHPYCFKHLIRKAAKILNYSYDKIHNIEQPAFHKEVQVKDFWLDNSKMLKYYSEPIKSLYQWIPEYIEYIKNNAKLSTSK